MSASGELANGNLRHLSPFPRSREGFLVTKTPAAPQNPEKISLRLLRASAQAERAELARREGLQELGFGAREFVFCGLPYKKPPGLEYERKDGNLSLRIEGSVRYGLPYGQDRLFLIWLATAFQVAGCPEDNTIHFRFAADIPRTFLPHPRPMSGIELRRLRQRIERVFGSTYYVHDTRGGKEPFLAEGYRLIRRVELWFQRKEHRNQYALFPNLIQLSADFANDLRKASVPIDIDTIRGLRANPAALDLYIWQAWRSFRLTQDPQASPVQIPIFGPAGLLQQLGTVTAEPFKARQLLRRWQAQVKAFWRDCPNELTKDGEAFVIKPAIAVLPGAKLKLEGVATAPIKKRLLSERPDLFLVDNPLAPADPVKKPEI